MSRHFSLRQKALSRIGWGLFYPTMYKGREAPLLHALVFVCPFPGKYGIIAREIPYDVILCHIGLIGATVLKLEGTLESSSTQRWFC